MTNVINTVEVQNLFAPFCKRKTLIYPDKHTTWISRRFYVNFMLPCGSHVDSTWNPRFMFVEYRKYCVATGRADCPILTYHKWQFRLSGSDQIPPQSGFDPASIRLRSGFDPASIRLRSGFRSCACSSYMVQSCKPKSLYNIFGA